MFRGLVLAGFRPHTPMGECGGACPPTIVARSESPPKGFFYEKCLIKYCNFIVNPDHSLCRRSDGRSCVNLRVFCPRRKPSIIYEGIVLWLCIILRDETVRE